ncbi:MAG: hypothetical protein K2Z80_27995 [Xanthobacteraceae bacterium]|nr:hypothetical protein [Xanthobacteraceae bacterium]
MQRLLGVKLQTAWGKPIVIENMAGAAGNIATAHVVKAEPDGYTLLMADNGSIVISPSLQKKNPELRHGEGSGADLLDHHDAQLACGRQ